MFKTHVVDCSHLLEGLLDEVPQHVTSARVNAVLTKRIAKRLLTQAIFDALPVDCSSNNINLQDYRLLDNVEPVELARMLDNTTDNIKQYLYGYHIDLTKYCFISSRYDGQRLYLKVGGERWTEEEHPPSVWEDYLDS